MKPSALHLLIPFTARRDPPELERYEQLSDAFKNCFSHCWLFSRVTSGYALFSRSTSSDRKLNQMDKQWVQSSFSPIKITHSMSFSVMLTNILISAPGCSYAQASQKTKGCHDFLRGFLVGKNGPKKNSAYALLCRDMPGRLRSLGAIYSSFWKTQV